MQWTRLLGQLTRLLAVDEAAAVDKTAAVGETAYTRRYPANTAGAVRKTAAVCS